MATDRFGIDDDYHDTRGVKHETSRPTRVALCAAMGVAPDADAPTATRGRLATFVRTRRICFAA